MNCSNLEQQKRVYKIGEKINNKTLVKDVTHWKYVLYLTNMLYLIRIHISIGCMENGTTLGDVELPPWAKGDPQEFIRIHREVSEP